MIPNYQYSICMKQDHSEKQEEDQFDEQSNPFQEEGKEESPLNTKEKKKKLIKKVKKGKKSKKAKKEKGKKSKSKHAEYEEDDEEDEINSMFDEEAESGEEDEGDEQYEAEVGFDDEKDRFAELYRRPNATERLLERFQGKGDKEINAQYNQRAYMIRQQQELFPTDKDPRLYIINVKPRFEEELVVCILNKAKHFAQKGTPLPIISVLALKRKYPGKIFVEAFSERDVYKSLQGFNNLNLSLKISKLDNEGYLSLFNRQKQEKNQFLENSYVRIKKGLYEGDLAKIFKIKKASIDVLLVPRINIQQILRKIKQVTANISDETQLAKKKQELFKIFIDHRTNNYRQRPSKKQLFTQDFADIKDFPGIKSIRLASLNGLIVLNYQFNELSKVQGTYLPVEIMPFTTQGNFIDEIKEEGIKMNTEVAFKIGEDVEIIQGELEKHFGTLIQIKNKVGIIRCKNKQMKGQILQQPLEHIAKRFQVGQRVKVTSGVDVGKCGTILTIQPKDVQIWTDNQNSIKVNKKVLIPYVAETICNQNVHKLKKDDLVKTNKNIIGVVLQTTMDNFKLINTQNVIQVFSNMDFNTKIQPKHLVAKNKNGEQIKQGGVIIIRMGINQGKRCRVIHVYRQAVFLFNQNFIRTSGVIVQNADNCVLLSKNDTGRVRLTTKPATSIQNQDNNGFEEQQITVGMTITLKQGPLKGYKGIVKSINKQKIQVKIPSKGCTEWVLRKTLSSKVNNNNDRENEGSSTPNRGMNSFKAMNSFRAYEQPSPRF